MWLLMAILIGIPHYFLPFPFGFVGMILVILGAQYLWRKGFFNDPKYHSRHDQEVARKIEASQRRLREEERRRKMME
jgi:hypothetical protein